MLGRSAHRPSRRRAWFAVLLSAALAAIGASDRSLANGPPCPEAGTVFSQIQIGQWVGGFGEGLGAGDRYGISVASVGDIDGDGINDLAVGAQLDDDGGTNHGAVWILFLNGGGTVKSKQKISSTSGGFGSGLANGDGFGIAVASLGDLDDDGIFDLAVGANGADDGGTDRGAVWILFLNPDGTVKSKQKISSTSGGFDAGLANGDSFGISIAALEDLDGDGVIDIAVGAFRDDDGGADRGAVWVLFLTADGTVKSKQKISSTSGGFGAGLANGDGFGVSVAAMGDLDDDGVIELGAGAAGSDDGGTDRGALWVLFLNADGTVNSKQKISTTSGAFGAGLANGDSFGVSLVTIGDLDEDGVTELAVGAHQSDDGGANRGALWILFLIADGTVKSTQKISQTAGNFSGSLVNNGTFGRAVTALEPTLADGRVRIVCGAYSGDAPLNPGEIWHLTLNTCSIGPEITEQPESVLLDIGGGLTQFSAAAEGSGMLTYQWRLDGTPLSNGGPYLGVNTPTLIVNATTAEVGVYDCVVSSDFGSTASWPAVLGIRSSCPGDLNGDGVVDGADLGVLLGAWGFCMP